MEQYKNEPWYPEWERGEVRRRRESGNPADILARIGPLVQPKPPVLSIPAGLTNTDAAGVLYRLLVAAGPQGIRPSEALGELRRQGHEYKHTGERVRRLVKAAEGKSTGRGRGSRWRLVQN